uniref:Uncharacterized protein n=1 Tax=Chlamydomonas moewusii TaxID=3054 RepID=O47541_CHLMO|nr:hypothetical protein [Chlamydomonas moewusii]AAC39338.1 unknown [Chlamydomonas moewusii]
MLTFFCDKSITKILSYIKNDQSIQFLRKKSIFNFDALNDLCFVRPRTRRDSKELSIKRLQMIYVEVSLNKVKKCYVASHAIVESLATRPTRQGEAYKKRA